MTVDSITDSPPFSSFPLYSCSVACDRLQSIPIDAVAYQYSKIMNGNVYRKCNQTTVDNQRRQTATTTNDTDIVVVRGIKYKCNQNGSLTNMATTKEASRPQNWKSTKFVSIRHQKPVTHVINNTNKLNVSSFLNKPVSSSFNLQPQKNPFKLNRNGCTAAPSAYTPTHLNRSQNGLRSKYKLVAALPTYKPLKPTSIDTATKPLRSRYKLVQNVSSFQKVFNRQSPIKTNVAKKEQLSRLLTIKSIKSSINRLRKKKSTNHLKLATNNQKFCMFFCRYGRCPNVSTCPFKHDPDKVAICTRFLRGTCKISNCPFSHKLSPDKMPVCSFFLKGVCNNDSCPYRHVKVAEHAQICPDFDRGYCAQGEQCKLLHQYSCSKCSSSKKRLQRCSDCQSAVRQDSPQPIVVRKVIRRFRGKSVTPSSSFSIKCAEDDRPKKNDNPESGVETRLGQNLSLETERNDRLLEEEHGKSVQQTEESGQNKLPAFIPLFTDTSAKDCVTLGNNTRLASSTSPLQPASGSQQTTATAVGRNFFSAYDSEDTWFEGESEEETEELIPFVPSFLYHL